jgi:hypothetical protein
MRLHICFNQRLCALLAALSFSYIVTVAQAGVDANGMYQDSVSPVTALLLCGQLHETTSSHCRSRLGCTHKDCRG